MTSDYTFSYVYFLRKTKYWHNTFFSEKCSSKHIINEELIKLPSVIDKVTIFHEKCHSLYIKELLKLLLSGLDIVIISLDELVFLISPNVCQDEPDVFH